MRADASLAVKAASPVLPRTTAARRFHMVLPATPLAVRQTVQDAARHAARATSEATLPGTLELVLAEAMNNIVEHAQAGHNDGVIELILTVNDDGLGVVLRDDGSAMPGARLPEAHPSIPEGADLDALPEGGFGWSLIRALAEGLSYRREQGWNETTLRIPRNVQRNAVPEMA